MEIRDFEFEGVKIISGNRFDDSRGAFIKKYERETYKENGMDIQFDEIFYSISHKNVLRGMHFQSKRAQAKLVTVIKGRVCDVIVDLRRSSPTFGKWKKVLLTEDNGISLYIPQGFAHGFLALDDENIMLYQCVGEYEPGYDAGIKYDDKEIDIDWDVASKDLIVSERDRCLMSFDEFKNIEREF